MSLAFWMTAGGVFFLLCLSAFFSGSETALTAASRAHMHQLEREGDKRASLVNRLIGDKEALIGALLLSNNLVNILASALATSVLITLFGEAGVAYATLGMTTLIVIFAEVLPKTYAINNADTASRAIAPIIRVVVIVLRPMVILITYVTRGVIRLFRADLGSIGDIGSDKELRGAIELHRGPEEETAHERAMLRSILDLADVEVSEIMTHRRNVVAVEADLPKAELVDAVLASPYTRIPLWRGDSDNIVAVLHAKALLRALRRYGPELTELEILDICSSPWFIPDTTTLLDQLQAFRARREHFALVVDEYGSLQGVVTLEDILEEIVGDISDEHDLPVAGVRVQQNGSLIVEGTVTIRDLNRQFEWDLPDEEASTIAGLVLHEARRIPEVGQTFTFYGFRFEILRRQRNQITSLRITPPVEPEEGAPDAAS
ncbi:MAG: HlyC/CorC family transporter [Azospirillaceae bacterium]